ncbi:phage gp6-like head-tail connector protein [Peribacillus sp. SCS-26]|uniref:phage gp6-like head-tail connector protein n=1 Tax=Paraperibacillus marinus TaxID=3115295 RepID=UPI0039057969
MITPEIVEEFKRSMHITHSSEDIHLKGLLSSSYKAIKRDCGEFDIEENEMGKELVFGRARYAYNDSLEFFQKNFLSELHSFSFTLLPDPEEGDLIDPI